MNYERDEMIRRQMDEIGKLINANLKNLANESFGFRPMKEERKQEECKIIQFPIKNQ